MHVDRNMCRSWHFSSYRSQRWTIVIFTYRITVKPIIRASSAVPGIFLWVKSLANWPRSWSMLTRYVIHNDRGIDQLFLLPLWHTWRSILISIWMVYCRKRINLTCGLKTLTSMHDCKICRTFSSIEVTSILCSNLNVHEAWMHMLSLVNYPMVCAWNSLTIYTAIGYAHLRFLQC